MKTIYCGTFTIVEYLIDKAKELGIINELESVLSPSYHSRLNKVLNHMQVQDPGLINALASHILGSNKYVIGYQVLKPGTEYYSDCMKKLLIQITGELQLKNACAKICGNYSTDSIYQILFSSDRFLSPKLLETIQIQGKCIILPCLAVNEDTCFGPGVNFSPDKEWNLNTSEWVSGTVEAMLESISCDTLDEDFEDLNDEDFEDLEEEEDEPDLNEEQQMVHVEQPQKIQSIEAVSDKEDATDIVTAFLTLRDDQQQLILEFAKSKCKLDGFNDQQIVLLYCLQLSNSDTIKDLVNTLSDF